MHSVIYILCIQCRLNSFFFIFNFVESILTLVHYNIYILNRGVTDSKYGVCLINLGKIDRILKWFVVSISSEKIEKGSSFLEFEVIYKTNIVFRKSDAPFFSKENTKWFMKKIPCFKKQLFPSLERKNIEKGNNWFSK